jgi:hypothetical protein
LQNSSNLQSVAFDNAPTGECARFGFDDRARVHKERSETLRLHCCESKNDTVAVEMGNIDGKPHAKCVHRLRPREEQRPFDTVSAK